MSGYGQGDIDMANVNVLGELINLTPGVAISILIVAVGVTILSVAAMLVLARAFSRRTSAEREDMIELIKALRGPGRRNG